MLITIPRLAKRWLAVGSLQVCALPIVLAQCVSTLLSASSQVNTLCPMVSSMTLSLGMVALARTPAINARRRDSVMLMAMAILFVIPSQQLGWLCVLLTGLLVLARGRQYGSLHNQISQGQITPKQAQVAGWIITLTAGANVLTTYSMKWFAGPILAFDAQLMAIVLSMANVPFQLSGNLLQGPSDHQLMILRGCSSLLLMGNSLLALGCVLMFRGAVSVKRFALLALLLGLAVLSLNLIRLTMMTFDLHWHQWWHSETGMMQFQLLSIALVFVVLALGGRHGCAAHAR
ncbi:hypothetical protein CHH28_13665 [Bacterioplanes sanyensis]|uniref:Exosortase/archaeosortase family protein n=1 Tax=Bacterioplanes sanyensis TaxID=1249553 RepID=A0A222FKU7_9GAMM|nr:hypothetical protein [Bacterioplanes sanyensis]ASP39655.1 hypothetical protein CHH28_13665 [Bacterioplanes sanyensis]